MFVGHREGLQRPWRMSLCVENCLHGFRPKSHFLLVSWVPVASARLCGGDSCVDTGRRLPSGPSFRRWPSASLKPCCLSSSSAPAELSSCSPPAAREALPPSCLSHPAPHPAGLFQTSSVLAAGIPLLWEGSQGRPSVHPAPLTADACATSSPLHAGHSVTRWARINYVSKG